MNRRIGVCSWSLQPTGPDDLAQKIRAAGIKAVQLALDPVRTEGWKWTEPRICSALAGITMVSGMMTMKGEDYSTLDSIKASGGVRPDDTWEDNLDAARENAEVARRLGISLVTFHAGFLPEDRDDPERAVMLDRLRILADTFGGAGVRIAFETGQESAATLLEVLDDLDRSHVGINFDPANMILYGMGDPVEAVRLLSPRIAQFHLKDAVPTKRPGEWGEEVPVGMGAVRWKAFFAAAREVPGDFVIEREAGGSRLADIVKARELTELAIKAGDA